MAEGSAPKEQLLDAMMHVAAALRDAEVPYLLAGSFAVWARGGPAHDTDLDFAIKSGDVERAVEETVVRLGRLDILVNNAGINRHSFVHEQPEEDWNAVLQIDLTGPMLCTRAAAQHMIPRGSGRIINISSIFGIVGYPKRAGYCAAKGALVNLTRQAGIDYAAQGINVNSVAPGFVETDMTAALRDEQKSFYTNVIPAGRIGKPEDVAAAVGFLASPAASYVTGHVLYVAGGLYM